MRLFGRSHLAYLQDQNKSGFLEVRLLSSQSKQSEKVFKKPWLAEKKAGPPKSHFCFDHVNRLIVSNYRAGSRPPQTSDREWPPFTLNKSLLVCLLDQNKSGFFGELAFFQPIRTFWILSKFFRLAG